MREWRGPEVCRAVGITYAQLDYWARTGLVIPSICTGDGTGTRRLYADRDVAELSLVVRMLHGGLTLQTARRAIALLQRQHRSDLAGTLLIANGGRRVYVCTNANMMRRFIAQQHDVFQVVSLDQLIPATAAIR